MAISGVRLAQRRAFLCASALGLVLSAGTALADVEDSHQEVFGAVAFQEDLATTDTMTANVSDSVREVPVVANGLSQGLLSTCEVDPQWSASAALGSSSAAAGQPVRVCASAAGAPSQDGFSYNFVWERDGWAEWDSTARSTGSFADDASWSFTPASPGSYSVYVDVREDATGLTRTAFAGTVEVSAAQWSASAALGSSSAAAGQPVRVCASAAGAPSQDGFSYNFVWERDGWAEWDSTARSTGSFADDASWSFTPASPGSYSVYVDVREDATGLTRTAFAGTVEVSAAQWSVSIELGSGYATVGVPVTVTPKVIGHADDVTYTYNYVYNYNGAWEEWGSTVLDSGVFTSQASWQFMPQREGTYELYVDVRDSSGQVRTASTSIEVDCGYSCEGIKASTTSLILGESVTLTPMLSGPSSSFTFNWGWERDGWVEWDSTVKSTGAGTTQASMTFTPTKPGTYTFFVDARRPGGIATTHTVQVLVKDPDTVQITDFQVTLSDRGSDVEFALPSGSVPSNGAARVAVWADGTDVTLATWYDFVRDDSGRWFVRVPVTAFGNGSYCCRVYARSASGDWDSYLERSLTLPLTPIMNTSAQVTPERLAAVYKRSGFIYPAQAYADKGAPTIEDFCAIVVDEARAEGVDSRVLFAQIMIETGGLQFGGDANSGQCNFGGIGATGSGVAGNAFVDVRTGVRAQVQHLKAYASKESLVNPVVDPRYTYVDHGVMPYVEGLGTRWAATSDYGWELASYIRGI